MEKKSLISPDNMVTYCVEEKLLFSNDAFGQHYGTRGRFDDEVPYDELMRQVSIYYANIVAPFSKMVASALKKLALFDIETIAPAHGVIWRSHIENALGLNSGPEFWSTLLDFVITGVGLPLLGIVVSAFYHNGYKTALSWSSARPKEPLWGRAASCVRGR